MKKHFTQTEIDIGLAFLNGEITKYEAGKRAGYKYNATNNFLTRLLDVTKEIRNNERKKSESVIKKLLEKIKKLLKK